MGSAGNKTWRAGWIRQGWGHLCPLLRHSFTIDKSLRKGVLRGTALGLCELRLNGRKVGDTHLLPGWTDYRKRVYFHEFDVTSQLVSGENVIGAILAPGWFAGFFGPFNDKGYYGHDAWFSAELELEFADGSTQLICSGPSWSGAEGPIITADLLMGEEYDARKEVDGWDRPGSCAASWRPVVCFRPEEERMPEHIERFPGAPVRTIEQLPAQAVSEPQPGKYIFDLGQNMVGVVRLKLRDLPPGTEVTIRHGEMLHADGSLYTENLRSAKATDRYITRGAPLEEWQPRFTFHGFRYVELTGLPAKPPVDTVTGQVWMSDLRSTASFECSNPKVNRLFQNILWGFRGNYLEVPTDCPQRDERLGWTGDTQIFIRSASYLADIRPFFEKWLVDLHDAQRPDGAYPDMAPFMGRMGHGRAAWGDAGVICPYVLWQTYNDLSFIRPWWTSMKSYMKCICAEGNLHNGSAAVSYGDWLHMNSETPVPLIGLAYRAYDARLMAEMAVALGESEDAEHFSEEAARSRTLFRDALFQNGDIAIRTQTACSLAIAMQLLEGIDLEKTRQCLVSLVEENKGYLNTGFIGTAYIAEALTLSHRADLAVQLLLNEGHPSWLYEVNNGATTIWERWNSWTREHGFGDISMNSFNHYAFGVIFEWMMERLAGIRTLKPGFQRIEIHPCFTGKLDFVRASYDSVQGMISVYWQKTPAGFALKLETPVPAEVRLPSGVHEVEPGQYEWAVPSLPDHS